MLKRRRGLSLVEILVVLAIMMILAGMLFPSALMLIKTVKSFGPHH
jgi:prepilin-type N-terminal cleavage/methylation domain-containing protein